VSELVRRADDERLEGVAGTEPDEIAGIERGVGIRGALTGIGSGRGADSWPTGTNFSSVPERPNSASDSVSTPL